MFQVGGPEFLVIVIVALIAVGPDQLPDVVRKLGRWASQFRSMTSGLRTEFMAGIDEIEASVREPMEEISATFREPAAELKRVIEDPDGTAKSDDAAKSGDAAKSDGGSASDHGSDSVADDAPPAPFTQPSTTSVLGLSQPGDADDTDDGPTDEAGSDAAPSDAAPSGDTADDVTDADDGAVS